MQKKYNSAKYGLTLQSLICDKYGIEANDYAKRQFAANFDEDFADELRPILVQIEELIGSKPAKSLTFTSEMINDKQTTSPHNFLLENGKTLSIRTTVKSGMVAPRTVGQGGYKVLNEYFLDIFGKEVKSQASIRKNIYKKIHKALPTFIECLFPSDFNVIVVRGDKPDYSPTLSLYKLSDLGDYAFKRKEFTFTRNLDSWIESTTLKYNGISIAEIQTHKNRTFKFRFKISKIPLWFTKVKETTETFGISAEAAICDFFGLEMPKSFNHRSSKIIQARLTPIIKAVFNEIPRAIQHTGSEAGARGKASKCSYDFVLDGNLKLSLKTNTGNRVCPPEVGQPGSATCLLYFKDYLPLDITEVSNTAFKQMVFDKIEQIIPIYLSHLFDSDWLLWIYKSGKSYKYETIHQDEINCNFIWEREKFSFTKNTIDQWNESNTVKYNNITIGEFQIHKNRVCFKFRFHMPNILKLIRN